jgi:hypothetical protein
MNWKLIFLLSLFGLVMGIATVFWIPSSIEPFFWLVIFVVCAYYVGKKASGKFFWHGFLISLVNCVWITSAHIIFVSTYLANHLQEAAMMAKMPAPDSPRLMMLLTGPVVGVISGLVLGLFAFVAGKIMKKPQIAATS